MKQNTDIQYQGANHLSHQPFKFHQSSLIRMASICFVQNSALFSGIQHYIDSISSSIRYQGLCRSSQAFSKSFIASLTTYLQYSQITGISLSCKEEDLLSYSNTLRNGIVFKFSKKTASSSPSEESIEVSFITMEVKTAIVRIFTVEKMLFLMKFHKKLGLRIIFLARVHQNKGNFIQHYIMYYILSIYHKKLIYCFNILLQRSFCYIKVFLMILELFIFHKTLIDDSCLCLRSSQPSLCPFVLFSEPKMHKIAAIFGKEKQKLVKGQEWMIYEKHMIFIEINNRQCPHFVPFMSSGLITVLHEWQIRTPHSLQIFSSVDLHVEFDWHIFFIPLILYEYWEILNLIS